MIVIVTESDCLCDGYSESDWQWFGLSLRVIAFYQWYWQWRTVIVIVTKSDCLRDGNSDSDWEWVVLSLKVIAINFNSDSDSDE